MSLDEVKLESEGALAIARLMAVAARTAPKTRGRDHLKILVLEQEELANIAAEMERLGRLYNRPSFIRDAVSLNQAQCMLLLGTRLEQLGLEDACGLCGKPNCLANKEAEAICIYNPLDLGIALGSAASIAADLRVDTRLMFSAGKAALSLGLFPPEIKIAIGIPLSVSGKNPFFDRNK